MKKKALLARIVALESRVVEVPTADLNWSTTVDKFKELEQKISRIESLERNQTALNNSFRSLAEEFRALERRLDNYKNRLTALEKKAGAGTLVEVFKKEEKKSGQEGR
jgi:predicted nuclease with TOPRIM domain